jgi:hypothetical protein
MYETIAAAQELQPIFDKSPVDSRAKRLPKVTIYDLMARVPRAVHTYLFALPRLIREWGGRIFDPPIRWLADQMGVHEKTIKRWNEVLRRAALFEVEQREHPQRRDRNLTNVYRLLVDFVVDTVGGGGGQKSSRDALLKNLKTTTPTAPLRGSSSRLDENENTRRQWEQRRAQDAKDHHRMRTQYEAVGLGFLEKRRLAAKAAFQCVRRMVEARIGTYTGPQSTMTDEQIAVARARVQQAQKESIEREKIAEQARKQATLERAAAYKRELAEMVTNPGWMKGKAV